MLDAETVAIRARERLTEKGEAEEYPLPRILAIVPDAREKLARMVAEDDQVRPLMTAMFELNAVAGEVDLADALAEDEPLLTDYLVKSSVFIEGAQEQIQVKPLPDRTAQRLEADGRSSYVVEGQTLVVKGPDGSYEGAVTIRRAPCLGSYERIEKVRLDEKLVDLVAAMAMLPRRTTQPKGQSA